MTTIYYVMQCHHQTYVSKAKFTTCDRVTSRVGYGWPSHLSSMEAMQWGLTCRRITLTLVSFERGFNSPFINQWKHICGLNFQPIAWFVYIYYVGHGHTSLKKHKTGLCWTLMATTLISLQKMHAFHLKTTCVALHAGNKTTVWWPQRCLQLFIMVCEIITLMIRCIIGHSDVIVKHMVSFSIAILSSCCHF